MSATLNTDCPAEESVPISTPDVPVETNGGDQSNVIGRWADEYDDEEEEEEESQAPWEPVDSAPVSVGSHHNEETNRQMGRRPLAARPQRHGGYNRGVGLSEIWSVKKPNWTGRKPDSAAWGRPSSIGSRDGWKDRESSQDVRPSSSRTEMSPAIMRRSMTSSARSDAPPPPPPKDRRVVVLKKILGDVSCNSSTDAERNAAIFGSGKPRDELPSTQTKESDKPPGASASDRATAAPQDLTTEPSACPVKSSEPKPTKVDPFGGARPQDIFERREKEQSRQPIEDNEGPHRKDIMEAHSTTDHPDVKQKPKESSDDRKDTSQNETNSSVVELSSTSCSPESIAVSNRRRGSSQLEKVPPNSNAEHFERPAQQSSAAYMIGQHPPVYMVPRDPMVPGYPQSTRNMSQDQAYFVPGAVPVTAAVVVPAAPASMSQPSPYSIACRVPTPGVGEQLYYSQFQPGVLLEQPVPAPHYVLSSPDHSEASSYVATTALGATTSYMRRDENTYSHPTPPPPPSRVVASGGGVYPSTEQMYPLGHPASPRFTYTNGCPPPPYRSQGPSDVSGDDNSRCRSSNEQLYHQGHYIQPLVSYPSNRNASYGSHEHPESSYASPPAGVVPAVAESTAGGAATRLCTPPDTTEQSARSRRLKLENRPMQRDSAVLNEPSVAPSSGGHVAPSQQVAVESVAPSPPPASAAASHRDDVKVSKPGGGWPAQRGGRHYHRGATDGGGGGGNNQRRAQQEHRHLARRRSSFGSSSGTRPPDGGIATTTTVAQSGGVSTSFPRDDAAAPSQQRSWGKQGSGQDRFLASKNTNNYRNNRRQRPDDQGGNHESPSVQQHSSATPAVPSGEQHTNGTASAMHQQHRGEKKWLQRQSSKNQQESLSRPALKSSDPIGRTSSGVQQQQAPLTTKRRGPAKGPTQRQDSQLNSTGVAKTAAPPAPRVGGVKVTNRFQLLDSEHEDDDGNE